MAAPRGEFTSRFGFLMAASGSAVGLGNIWGFPTNTASNGGAAFLFAYLILAFALAYPVLMAELIIGRHARANAVTALQSISSGKKSKLLALIVGFTGIVTVSFILSFYAVVSGWRIAHFFNPLARLVGMDGLAQWLTQDAVVRNSLFVVLFMAVTV
ncbi:MAG: sodium-dependent transporter, partial [Gammaproteobacteria bacterium]|nr:sodium-dependent transporter [Gammaproteobacteria bacterium]